MADWSCSNKSEKDQKRQNLKSSVVDLFVEVHRERRFEGMGGLNVANIRRERISLLWSTIRDRMMAKGFSFNVGDVKCQLD